jgi:hypothetical protein
MESLFNTCHALRDHLIAELESIKKKINPTNSIVACRAFPVSVFNGTVLQTPGGTGSVCFSDAQECKESMVDFLTTVASAFTRAVLTESDFAADSVEYYLLELRERYVSSGRVMPATQAAVREFLDGVQKQRHEYEFISGVRADLFFGHVARVLLDAINDDLYSVGDICKFAFGNGLCGEWKFGLASIIKETLLLPRFAHIMLSLDDVLLDVDSQGGKLDLLDIQGHIETKRLLFEKGQLWKFCYSHIVSTENAAFLEWKTFEGRCQGILLQTSEFSKFAAKVQQELEGTLYDIFVVHGAWPGVCTFGDQFF